MKEERGCVHELAGIGELAEPWRTNQINLLGEHLQLISEYSSSLKIMENHGKIKTDHKSLEI